MFLEYFWDTAIAHMSDLEFAAQVNAAGAVLLLRQPGQLPPVLPKGKHSLKQVMVHSS